MQDPSSLLVEVAALVHRWDVSGQIPDAWMDAAETHLSAAAKRRLSPGLSVEFLVAKARRALGSASLARPGLNEFLDATEALQALDGWHASLDCAAGAATVLDDLQEEAVRRLLVDGGGYNPPGAFGTIIPGDAGLDPARPDKTGVVAQLLHATVYLPMMVAAGDPDDPAAPSDRRVELRYVACSSRSGDPRGEIGECPRIAVAPVLQDVADAALELRPGEDRYGVRLRYDPSRLTTIVQAAMAGGAHLLFTPEMSVDAEQVEPLGSTIRRCTAAYRRKTGSLPQLRFVVVGLVHHANGKSDNSVIVLDIEGRRVLEQHKLCRWNLKWYHQRNYGIRPECAVDSADLIEDIPGGALVWIADLQHLGRFLILICADMDYDRPGDWLVRNVSVDWLHAPIMDKSIDWEVDGSGDVRQWIVKRARCAGENGVAKIVVTNSLFLTLLLNDHNTTSPDAVYPVTDQCTFAFMLDSKGGGGQFKQLKVPLPCPDITVEIFTWLEGFAPFPTCASPDP